MRRGSHEFEGVSQPRISQPMSGLILTHCPAAVWTVATRCLMDVVAHSFSKLIGTGVEMRSCARCLPCQWRCSMRIKWGRPASCEWSESMRCRTTRAHPLRPHEANDVRIGARSVIEMGGQACLGTAQRPGAESDFSRGVRLCLRLFLRFLCAFGVMSSVVVKRSERRGKCRRWYL